MSRPCLAAALVLVALALAPGSAQADLPVTYGPQALLAGGQDPDAVAGANDLSCKPSAAHPRPVVLVHGLSATLGTNWATLAPLLKNNGFCVFGLTYGRTGGFPYAAGFTRMEDSSAELAAFVDRVLAATGASKVDLLGHSEGTVMPRWYLSFRGGAAKVDKYVQMTPLWDGTQLAAIGTLSGVAETLGLGDAQLGAFSSLGCGSCPEFAKGSRYLDAVNAAGPAVPGVTYTEIATRYDELVIPYESGFLKAPNVTNVLLQDVCPSDTSEHLAVAYSPTVAQLVLNALDPAHARSATCTTTTPLGTPSPPEVGLSATPTAGSAVGTPVVSGRDGARSTASSAHLTTARIRVDPARRLALRVVCEAGGACPGTRVRLATKSRRSRVLARTRVSIAAGRTRTVRLRLSAAAARLARKPGTRLFVGLDLRTGADSVTDVRLRR